MADASPTLLQGLADKLQGFADWLLTMVHPAEGEGVERAFAALVHDLGGMVVESPPPAPDMHGIQALAEATDPSLEQWGAALKDVGKLARHLKAVVRFDPESDVDLDELCLRLMDALAGEYMRFKYPRVHAVMELLRFASEPPAISAGRANPLLSVVESCIRIVDFAYFNPMKVIFGAVPIDNERAAIEASRRLFLNMGIAVMVLRRWHPELDAYTGWDPAPLPSASQADDWELSDADWDYFWPKVAESSEADLVRAPADGVLSRMISLRWHDTTPTLELPEGFDIRATLALTHAAEGGAGCFYDISLPAGPEAFLYKKGAEGWRLQLGLSSNGERRLVGHFGGAGAHLWKTWPPIELLLESSSSPLWRLTFAGDNGLQIGRLVASLTLDWAVDPGSTPPYRFTPRLSLQLLDNRLGFDGSQFDGFIGSLLGGVQKQIEFDFGLGYTREAGFFTTGSLPLLSRQGGAPASARASAAPAAAGDPGGGPAEEAPRQAAVPELPMLGAVEEAAEPGTMAWRLPIGKKLGGLQVDHALISFSANAGDASAPSQTRRLRLAARLSGTAKIGPIQLAVEDVGLAFALSVPDDDALMGIFRGDAASPNLGLGQFDIDFLAPRGIGFSVDASLVKGGGLLVHDESRHQYIGAAELRIAGQIDAQAIGVLSTRLPDGRKGYSWLLIITAQSARPGAALTHLPMGFRLTGIGGLVGIHRTFDESVLKNELQNDRLDQLLFPTQVIADAPALVNALQTAFPRLQDSWMLGLMLKVDWGAAPLFKLALGVVVQWGARDRVLMIGRLESVLPRPELPLLALRMDVLGVIDFNRGTAALDAMLAESSSLFGRFPITGDAALRMGWRRPRSLALAVGGFHPDFAPPPGFPQLRRVALALCTGDNPRLTCEAYVALTSNTAQFGASADLYVAAWGVSVAGGVSFHTLIEFDPFHFIAEFKAWLAVKYKGYSLLSVELNAALEGPRPLSLRADCTFEVFWFDVGFSFRHTFIEGERPSLPPAVNVAALVAAAVGERRSWSVELPASQNRLVVLGPAPSDALMAHPLGRLEVRQTVAPLGVAIEHIAGAPVTGDNKLDLTMEVQGLGTLTRTSLLDDFPLAQFFKLERDERLAASGFQPMDAGCALVSDAVAWPTHVATQSLTFEDVVIGPDGQTLPTHEAPAALALGWLAHQVRFSAAGSSPLRQLDGSEVSRGGPSARLAVQPQAFSVAPLDADGSDPTQLTPLSFVEARAHARQERQTRRVALWADLVTGG